MTERVLVLGATGVVGQSAARRFLADESYDVVTFSRRRPELPESDRARQMSVDLLDGRATEAALRDAGPVSRVVYAALYEKPNLIAGWQDREQIDTNTAMLANVLDGLRAVGAPLRHFSLLQGTKAYGFHVTKMRVPAKESQARVEHENFYWTQQDLLLERAAADSFDYTIFRPQFIFGDATGAAMNLIPVIGCYAAIRRELGEPFSFPGGASYVAEAVDSRLLASALHWAAHAPTARNETFNITNGDVFDWRDLWPSFAETLEVSLGADASMSLSDWLPQQEHVWQRVVRRNGLRELSLREIIGYSHTYADNAFAWAPPGATVESRDNPVLLSTIKLRQAGFAECVDTEVMFRHWLGKLRADRIIP